MNNLWINHVKNYAITHNIPYKRALSDAKYSYVKNDVLRGKGVFQSKRVHPDHFTNINSFARELREERRNNPKEEEEKSETSYDARKRINEEKKARKNVEDQSIAIEREKERAEKKLINSFTLEKKREYNANKYKQNEEQKRNYREHLRRTRQPNHLGR